LLDELGLPCWIKTSGSKGFHIATSLDGRTSMEEAAGFAHAVGRLLVKRHPKELTLEFHKRDRAGRILVDTGRNDYSATFAAAYAVRARRGAPVSAPCTWEEVIRGDVGPATFTVRNMADRLAATGDLWADMRKRRRSLTPAIAKLRRAV
jgi:bifunctional non-homologous end joining protein LigD